MTYYFVSKAAALTLFGIGLCSGVVWKYNCNERRQHSASFNFDIGNMREMG